MKTCRQEHRLATCQICQECHVNDCQECKVMHSMPAMQVSASLQAGSDDKPSALKEAPTLAGQVQRDCMPQAVPTPAASTICRDRMQRSGLCAPAIQGSGALAQHLLRLWVRLPAQHHRPPRLHDARFGGRDALQAATCLQGCRFHEETVELVAHGFRTAAADMSLSI